jgi:hypothetical protein
MNEQPTLSEGESSTKQESRIYALRLQDRVSDTRACVSF